MDEKMLYDWMNKVDQINKRLVTAVIAGFAAIVLVVALIVGFYFFSDYSYPQVEQQQQTGSTTQTQHVGGDN